MWSRRVPPLSTRHTAAGGVARSAPPYARLRASRHQRRTTSIERREGRARARRTRSSLPGEPYRRVAHRSSLLGTNRSERSPDSVCANESSAELSRDPAMISRSHRVRCFTWNILVVRLVQRGSPPSRAARHAIWSICADTAHHRHRSDEPTRNMRRSRTLGSCRESGRRQRHTPSMARDSLSLRLITVRRRHDVGTRHAKAHAHSRPASRRAWDARRV